MDLQRNASLRIRLKYSRKSSRAGDSAKEPDFEHGLQRLGTSGNRGQGIVYLMHHARREPANRREFLSTSDCAICFHPGRNVLTHSDHMRNSTAVVNPHRDLANQPILDLTVWLYRFLFNDFDFASRKNLGKLSL